jgi:hypothetical protein
LNNWIGGCIVRRHGSSRSSGTHEEIRRRHNPIRERLAERSDYQSNHRPTNGFSRRRRGREQGRCRARSRADFIYKLGNTIEEADESALWLEILNEAELSPRSSTDSLWKEADELVRILVRSRETARANSQSRTRK